MNKLFTWKKTLAVLLSFVMILSLAACGNNNQQKADNEITVAISTDFDSLDPHLSGTAATQQIMLNVYEGLGIPKEDGTVGSGLAESWTQEGNVYTFHLRRGVKFHDGSDFDADDAVYSIKRVCGMLPDDQTAIHSSWSKYVTDVEKEDAYTVKLTLNAPYTYFSTNFTLAMIPEGSGASLAEASNGTGAYRLDSYEAGVGAKLSRFEDHWAKKASIDTINVKIVSNASSGLLALQNGEIQMMGITQSDLEMLPDGYTAKPIPQNTPIVINYDMSKGIFSDLRLRQALNYATDKKALVDALNPGAEILDGPITSITPFWLNPAIKGYYSYDVNKAKALMSDAGYPDGFSFKLYYSSDNSEYLKLCAQVLQQQWEKAGIKCTIEDMEWNTFYSTIYKVASNEDRVYDAAIFGYGGDFDPNNTFYRWQTSNKKTNIFGFDNAEFDQVIEDAKTEADLSARQAQYYRAQEILCEQALGVWLQDAYGYVALADGLSGYVAYPITFWDFASLSLNK